MQPKRPRKRIKRRISARYQLPKDAVIDYKDIPLLQKFLNDRGKMVARRISGITAIQQRRLNTAIKQARYLALLTSGSVSRR